MPHGRTVLVISSILLWWCGGGAFLLACKDFGECSTIHFQPALLLFVLEVEISLCVLIPLFSHESVYIGPVS